MSFIDMNTYSLIRRLHAVEKLSQRQIAKRLHVSRKTIRKYCNGSFLPGIRQEYQIEKNPDRLAIEEKIIKVIEENKGAPSKQALNAKVIWQILLKEGYTHAESTIRKYIQELKLDKPDIFIPLDFEPGDAMEFDWGDVYAYIEKVKTKISIFCAVLPFSYGIFCAVFPNKTNVNFYAGHIMAFEHFNGVPRRCIYDNLKSVVLEGSGINAITQQKFKKLEAHYVFEAVLCTAASGWEKGSVENLVSVARKIAFTPMPSVSSFSELQEHVTHKCLEYCMTHKIKGRARGIKEMLEEEKNYLLPLPIYPLDSAEEVKALVHNDLTVHYINVKYSVPQEYIGLSVTLKIYPFNIDIYHRGSLIYSHKKALHLGEHQYITEHYLDILIQKPRAIKNAAPISKGIMPAELIDFMKLCKDRNRNYELVNILLLSRKIASENLLWAVKQANITGSPSYDLVCFYLDIQNQSFFDKNPVEDSVKVNTVDLDKYDELIPNRGE